MKRIVFSAFIITVAIFFVSSCGNSASDISGIGIDLSDSSKLVKINEVLFKHINPDMLVHEITFNPSSNSLSSTMERATIIYVSPENPKALLGIDVDLKSGAATENTFYKKRTVSKNEQTKKGIKLEKLDLRKITKNYNAAVVVMASESLIVNGIGQYRICFSDGKPEKESHRFTLCNKTGTKRQGKRIITEYAEYTFEGKGDGNVEPE